MAGRPDDEMEPDGGAGGRHDREHVIDALKAAFAQGRLGKDEFDHRVGLALAAYAELDELTADIPATRPAALPAVSPAAEAPLVTRDAYNRGLVARGAIGGAGGVMLLVTIVVTAVSGNLFMGFMLGGVFGTVMAVVLGTFLTLTLWVLESSGGRMGGTLPRRPATVISPAVARLPGHRMPEPP